ncbi:hypothetical protein [Ferrimicrobium sp.]|uniref:hypothetical protein n=1 Tax=Ferrimicrobium sp. TaxID=2926050 RepID=UPI0026257028|nr:hypothetical protein [Ferrimicrobium sp.]
MRRPDAKSLALARAVQRKIANADDPRIYIRQAQEWALKFSRQRPEDIWLAEWVERLSLALASDDGLADLYTLMLSPEQHGIDMRSSSPFAGVLTQSERTAVLRAFESEWAA